MREEQRGTSLDIYKRGANSAQMEAQGKTLLAYKRMDPMLENLLTLESQITGGVVASLADFLPGFS